MQVRKFEAASLDEALHLVKTELGPHALILSTKNRKPRWFNRGVIEVTAAYEPTKEPPPSLDQVFDEQSLVNIFPHRRKKDSDQPNERTDARNDDKHEQVPDLGIAGGQHNAEDQRGRR